MEHEDQREFYTCPLCGQGTGNDIDNAVYGTPEHICPEEEAFKKQPMKNTDDILKEFDKDFYEIMGLEVAPDGTDGLYLIRNERGRVENGIDFSEEKEDIKSCISSAILSRDEEWKKKLMEIVPETIVPKDHSTVFRGAREEGFIDGHEDCRQTVIDKIGSITNQKKECEYCGTDYTDTAICSISGRTYDEHKWK